MENSRVVDPPLLLWKENPPDSGRGVDGSRLKEDDSDDWHVCPGDAELNLTGAAVPKLMSSFLVINGAAIEPGLVSNSSQLCFSLINGTSECGVRFIVHS